MENTRTEKKKNQKQNRNFWLQVLPGVMVAPGALCARPLHIPFNYTRAKSQQYLLPVHAWLSPSRHCRACITPSNHKVNTCIAGLRYIFLFQVLPSFFFSLLLCTSVLGADFTFPGRHQARLAAIARSSARPPARRAPAIPSRTRPPARAPSGPAQSRVANAAGVCPQPPAAAQERPWRARPRCRSRWGAR